MVELGSKPSLSDGSPHHKAVSVCCKHFVVLSLEFLGSPHSGFLIQAVASYEILKANRRMHGPRPPPRL
jgi:hypothetical protein